MVSPPHHSVKRTSWYPLSTHLQQPIGGFTECVPTTTGHLGVVSRDIGQHEPAWGFCRKQGVNPNSPAKPFPASLGRKGSDGLKQARAFVQTTFSLMRAARTTQINQHRRAKNNGNQELHHLYP